jgi:hypothetical protein
MDVCAVCCAGDVGLANVVVVDEDWARVLEAGGTASEE